MSFGVEDKSAPFVTPIANAEEVGVPVVASVGNDGVNTSSSPANVYESIAVGAINESDSVPVFSSGERINTTAEWKDPPARWPPEYTVPDVVAPGTNIMSSYTDGGYRRLTGTSMSAPHVGGVLALLLSAVDAELTPGHLRERLTTAADTPPPDSAEPTRSGAGIVNASALLATPNEPVGSVQYPPRDLDFDGRYEDVNGDGEFTVVDVSAFFKNYRGVTVQSNPTMFDFNGDGVVTIVDVSRLFLSLA
jgi:subtilisin family serine protease